MNFKSLSTLKIAYLNAEDCYCNIFDLYERAAKKAGYTVTDTTKFDCRKVHCSEAVQTEVEKYHRKNGFSNLTFAAIWINYGPKADIFDKKHSQYVMAFEDGAIFERNDKND